MLKLGHTFNLKFPINQNKENILNSSLLDKERYKVSGVILGSEPYRKFLSMGGHKGYCSIVVRSICNILLTKWSNQVNPPYPFSTLFFFFSPACFIKPLKAGLLEFPVLDFLALWEKPTKDQGQRRNSSGDWFTLLPPCRAYGSKSDYTPWLQARALVVALTHTYSSPMVLVTPFSPLLLHIQLCIAVLCWFL